MIHTLTTNRKNIASIILILTLFLTTSADAQNRRVTGKVVSGTDNQPLAGVSVQIKGTTTGTTTDNTGNYSISASDDATLTFGYVGYTPQEITVGNQSTINVTLVNTAASMN